MLAAIPIGEETMDRELDALPVHDGFRLRGVAMTRLETFTDAAFAFAVTVLVIAGGQVPDSFELLMRSLEEIPAFLASFAIIVMFWYGHHEWSRRYGLDDGRSVLLSLALVFVVLVYVVPLKVLFGQVFAWVSQGRLGSAFAVRSVDDMTDIFVVYGIGYVAMSSCLALLNHHALRHADPLKLSPLERFRTRIAIEQWVVGAIPGLVSVLMAAFLPARLGVWAGFAYATMPVLMPLWAMTAARRERQLHESGATT